MRQVRLAAFGGPEVLEIQEVEVPAPPAEGYLVELRAIGVNFAEIVERRGRYRREQQLPAVLGKEAAGVIVDRGPGARDFELGETVIVVSFAGGCYADYFAASPHQLLRGPASYGFEELAAFANSFATAWYALVEQMRARRGEAILITAAAGALGSAAVALARALGLEPVIGLAGSGAKCRFVEERLGAHACFETAGDQLGTRIRSLTAGRGIDLVLDSVGGSVLDLALELLAPLGRLVSVGFSSIDRDYRGALPTLHLLELFHRSISVSGLNLENLDYPRRQSAWRELVSFVECHGLRPVVGEIFPLHHVAAAHQALESRATFGKLILRPGVRPAAGARAPFELTAQPPE